MDVLYIIYFYLHCIAGLAFVDVLVRRGLDQEGVLPLRLPDHNQYIFWISLQSTDVNYRVSRRSCPLSRNLEGPTT